MPSAGIVSPDGSTVTYGPGRDDPVRRLSVRKIATGAVTTYAYPASGSEGGRPVWIAPDGSKYATQLSDSEGNTSIQQMYAAGVRPETRQVVVAKGVVSPRPAYAPIAAEIILVDTPGVTSADLSRFPYRQRRRPLYPFERDARYPTAK